MVRALATLCALALTCSVWPARVAAEENVVAAANAYAQAQQAELRGDHDRAAELFELADRIAPTGEALRSATRTRLAAGQLALAAGNAEELLARYPDDAASRELAEQVIARAQPELTRYTFECSAPCTVAVDDVAIAATARETQIVYVAPGSHNVQLGFDDTTQRAKLAGVAGEARTLKVQRPARAPKPSAPPSQAASDTAPGRRALSPVYFWTAASLTVVAGGLALWSGLDLLNARDEFKAKDMPTRAEFDDGESKDLRTSILIGTAGVLAVGTATLAAFTRFGGKDKRTTASLSFDGRAAQLQLRGQF